VPSRRAEIVDARNAAAHLLRHRRGMGTPEIASALGMASHASVSAILRRRSDRAAYLIAVATATLKPITENAA
jgi:chromosomal replication initiation ATPase DnaA